MLASRYLKILLFIIMLSCVSWQCHYTCLTCSDNQYTGCTSCSETYSLSEERKIQLTRNSGSCVYEEKISVNYLGIVLLTTAAIGCLVFGGEKMYYFLLMFQTLGLLFFLQIYWLQPLNYLLQSYTYFMTFSLFTYPLKENDLNFKAQAGFKVKYFLKNGNLRVNMIIIGPFLATVLTLIIILTLCKIVRKVRGPRRVQGHKTQTFINLLNTCYFLTIQQSMLVILASLKYGTDNLIVDYILSVIYFMSLILFAVNQCNFHLTFFRNQKAQFFMFISKIMGPLFIVFPNKIHFLFYIYFLTITVIEMVATNQNKDKGKPNILFLYKFLILLSTGSTLVYYIVERATQSQTISLVFGILTILMFFILMKAYLVEIVLSISQKYCKEKKDLVQESQIESTQQGQNKRKYVPSEAFFTINNQLTINQSVANVEESQPSLIFQIQNIEPSLVFSFPQESELQNSKPCIATEQIMITSKNKKSIDSYIVEFQNLEGPQKTTKEELFSSNIPQQSSKRQNQNSSIRNSNQ